MANIQGYYELNKYNKDNELIETVETPNEIVDEFSEVVFQKVFNSQITDDEEDDRILDSFIVGSSDKKTDRETNYENFSNRAFEYESNKYIDLKINPTDRSFIYIENDLVYSNIDTFSFTCSIEQLNCYQPIVYTRYIEIYTNSNNELYIKTSNIYGVVDDLFLLNNTEEVSISLFADTTNIYINNLFTNELILTCDNPLASIIITDKKKSLFYDMYIGRKDANFATMVLKMFGFDEHVDVSKLIDNNFIDDYIVYREKYQNSTNLIKSIEYPYFNGTEEDLIMFRSNNITYPSNLPSPPDSKYILTYSVDFYIYEDFRGMYFGYGSYPDEIFINIDQLTPDILDFEMTLNHGTTETYYGKWTTGVLNVNDWNTFTFEIDVLSTTSPSISINEIGITYTTENPPTVRSYSTYDVIFSLGNTTNLSFESPSGMHLKNYYVNVETSSNINYFQVTESLGSNIGSFSGSTYRLVSGNNQGYGYIKNDYITINIPAIPTDRQRSMIGIDNLNIKGNIKIINEGTLFYTDSSSIVYDKIYIDSQYKMCFYKKYDDGELLIKTIEQIPLDSNIYIDLKFDNSKLNFDVEISGFKYYTEIITDTSPTHIYDTSTKYYYIGDSSGCDFYVKDIELSMNHFKSFFINFEKMVIGERNYLNIEDSIFLILYFPINLYNGIYRISQNKKINNFSFATDYIPNQRLLKIEFTSEIGEHTGTWRELGLAFTGTKQSNKLFNRTTGFEIEKKSDEKIEGSYNIVF